MAYTPEAFVMRSAAADEAIRSLTAASAVPLAQGISLIPLTPSLMAGFKSSGYPGSDFEFKDLPTLAACAAGWAKRISRREPVAFLAAEFFGGLDSQAAIGWQAGKLAFGPVQAGDAINQALRWLGVTRAAQAPSRSAIGDRIAFEVSYASKPHGGGCRLSGAHWTMACLLRKSWL